MKTAMTPSEYTAWAAAKQGADAGKFTASTGGKVGLNTIGKGIAAAGAVYGAGNLISNWINQDSHRSVGDMVDTATTNTYTTDRGTIYKELSGFDSDAEREYESANRTNKNVSNTLDAVGTGASIGSLIPGAGLVGTALGAVGGLLYGLGSWAFGFGDNSDEIEQGIKDT